MQRSVNCFVRSLALVPLVLAIGLSAAGVMTARLRPFAVALLRKPSSS